MIFPQINPIEANEFHMKSMNNATFKLGLDKVRTSRTLYDKDFLMN
jgi:hypothetical protein